MVKGEDVKFRVNTRASITWYVEADSAEEAWQKGEDLGARSIMEYGFDREPGSVAQLHPEDPEWEEAMTNTEDLGVW